MFITNCETGEILLHSRNVYYIGINKDFYLIDNDYKKDDILLFKDIVYKLLPLNNNAILLINNEYYHVQYNTYKFKKLDSSIVPYIVNIIEFIIYTTSNVYIYDNGKFIKIYTYEEYNKSFNNVFQFDGNKIGIINTLLPYSEENTDLIKIVDNVDYIGDNLIIINNEIYDSNLNIIISEHQKCSNSNTEIKDDYLSYYCYNEEFKVFHKKTLTYKEEEYTSLQYGHFYIRKESNIVLLLNRTGSFYEYILPDGFIIPDLLKVIPSMIKSARN